MEDLITTPAEPVRGPAAFPTATVSWPAILAGAFVAIGASIILMTLGAGLGFAAASPSPYRGASAAVLTTDAAVWLIVTQWLSAALGGYIAGRLRARWIGTHTHEVFFRDTAHGLVTWAVATVAVAVLVGGSTSSVLGGGAQAVSRLAAGGAYPELNLASDSAALKATAEAALYTALSLLVGAFIASVSAAIGGRLRDEHV